MELKPALFNKFFGTRVGRVNHRHLVALGHVVDSLHQAEKVLFVVNVFLPMSRNKQVIARRQAHALENITLFNLCHVVAQNLPHGGAGNKNGFAVYALAEQVTAGMLGIGQVDVADMIHNFTVDHLRHVPIPAPVTRLHMENGDFKPLGRDGRKSRVGVA